MTINLTKPEYRLLLDMLYLSDWMMHSYLDDVEEDGHPEYLALRKKILSYSKEMDVEDIISYDSKYDDYFESQEYEISLHEKFIDPYNDDIFWDELIERLALRDMDEIADEKKDMIMGRMERYNMVNELSEVYEDEFAVNGVKNLRIQKV